VATSAAEAGGGPGGDGGAGAGFLAAVNAEYRLDEAVAGAVLEVRGEEE
jgi:hypothetical protein